MTAWTNVCQLNDIPVLGSRRIQRAQGMDVALFRTATDEVYAVLDRCPHKGGPLSQGIVFGSSVACPLHNWTIELSTGCARAPDQGEVARFAARVHEGWVQVDPEELRTRALDLPAPLAGPCLRRQACA